MTPGQGSRLCGACTPAAGPCSARDGGTGAMARHVHTATLQHSSGSRAHVPCSQHYCLPSVKGPGPWQYARPKNSGNKKNNTPPGSQHTPQCVPAVPHPRGHAAAGSKAKQEGVLAGDPRDPPVPHPSPGRACWFQRRE